MATATKDSRRRKRTDPNEGTDQEKVWADTRQQKPCAAKDEDTSEFKKAFLDTIKKHMFVFEVYEGVSAFGPHGCTIRDNVIAFWREHFVYREEMHEIYSPSVSVSCDDITWSTQPETEEGTFADLEYLYRHNEIIKLPFAAARVIQKALRCEEFPQHRLLNIDDSPFAQIEHYMDSHDSSHPKYSEVSGLNFSVHSLEGVIALSKVNDQSLAFFIGRVYLFLTCLGIDENRLQFRQLPIDVMDDAAAAYCWVAEIKSHCGWVRCVTITHRSACAHEKNVITPNKEELLQAFKKNDITPDAEELLQAFNVLDYEEAMEMKYTLEQKEEINFEVGTLQKTVLLTKNMVSLSPKTIESSLIKLSFRIGRIISCIYEHSFHLRRDSENQQLCVFRFPPLVAPIKCTISFTHPNYRESAISISQKLGAAGIVNELDISGKSVGHARINELGVPFAVVVNSETSVTIRGQDSNEEIELPNVEVVAAVKDLANGCCTLGTIRDKPCLW